MDSSLNPRPEEVVGSAEFATPAINIPRYRHQTASLPHAHTSLACPGVCRTCGCSCACQPNVGCGRFGDANSDQTIYGVHRGPPTITHLLLTSQISSLSTSVGSDISFGSVPESSQAPNLGPFVNPTDLVSLVSGLSRMEGRSPLQMYYDNIDRLPGRLDRTADAEEVDEHPYPHFISKNTASTDIFPMDRHGSDSGRGSDSLPMASATGSEMLRGISGGNDGWLKVN